jgi:hypothetical protein
MSRVLSASRDILDLVGTLTGDSGSVVLPHRDVITYDTKGCVRGVAWRYRCKVHSQATGLDGEVTMKNTQGALTHALQDLAKKVAI